MSACPIYCPLCRQMDCDAEHCASAGECCIHCEDCEEARLP